jgi:ADP-ribose pyrophosphatase YjhB (NUDIX family)
MRSRADVPVTVSALIERDGAILLVEEQGPRDPEPAWMLPGGRVEVGETPVDALRRELAEETGLALVGSPRLAFIVDVEAALEDLVGRWRAFTFACEAVGDLMPADPDGLILAAEWADRATTLARLEAVEWYDSAPLRAFLAGSAAPGARYGYGLTGRRGAVTRSVVEILEPGP